MSNRFSRFVLLLFLSWNLILQSHIYATGSTIKWAQNLLPSTEDDLSQRAVTDSEGNVYVTGHSKAPTAFGESNNGDFDIFVAKIALNRTLVWGKYFGTSSLDQSFAIVLDTLGNPIISGFSNGNWDVINKGEADMLIVKLDKNNGTIMWSRLFGGPSEDFSYGVTVSPSDNGVIASGWTTGNIPNTTAGYGGQSDCVLIKLTANGAPQWNQIFGTSGADTASGVLVDPSGDIFVTGSTDGTFPNQTNYGLKDGFLLKFTSSGMVTWYRQFGSNDTDLFYSVAFDSAHNVIACGQVRGTFFESSWGGQADAGCIEYDQSGTKIWAMAAGGSGWDSAWTVTINRTSTSATAGSPALDSIFIAGYTDGFVEDSEGQNDILLMRLNSAGQLQWAEQLGSAGNDQATGVAFDSGSGNLYAVGFIGGDISGVIEDYESGSDAFVLLVGPPFSSNFDSKDDDKSVDKAVVVGAVLGSVLGVIVLGGVGAAGFLYMRKRSNIKMMDIFNSEDPQESNGALSASSLPSIGSGGSGITQKRTTNSAWEIDYADLNLEKKIGQGSSGVVYRAKWRKTEVAVKQLLINKSSDKDIENFRAEAELMRNLRPNKNVLLYYGVCTDPLNPLCIVTEFVANGNLWTLLQNSSFKWTNQLKLKIIKGVAAGMYHLAKEKLVHRDLAARNILLNEHFEAKISDFGLSRVVENEDDSNQTSTNVGPIRWMSPEAIMQRVYSEKSDVWSFAVLVYEVMTQSQPYAGVSQLNVATSIGNRQLRLNYPKDIPVISPLLEKCLDWEADNRPRFEEVVETLEHVTVNDKDQFVETK